MRKSSRLVLKCLILVILLALLPGVAAQPPRVQAQGTETPQRMVIDTTVSPKDEIKALRAASLIPGGGTLYVNTKEGAFVQARQQGFNYLQQFSDIAPIDFVLQFRVVLQMQKSAAAGSACGFFFRKNEFGSSYVAVSNDRQLYLYQNRKDQVFINTAFKVDDISELDPKHYDTDGYIHTVTIIAIQDTLTFFMNGVQVITTSDGRVDNGILAMLLYNAEAQDDQNACSYDNLWVLDLTQYTS